MGSDFAGERSSVLAYGYDSVLVPEVPRGRCGRGLGDGDNCMTRAARIVASVFGKDSSVMERPERPGVSGSYVIREGMETPLAIFKPRDEEMVDDTDRVLRDFVPGCGAEREVAAYLLDRRSFVAVPETILTAFRTGGQKRDGMLQRYVENEGDVDDFGPSVFDVEDVQRIAAFDLRVLNADRHGGNLLVSCDGEKHKLWPIDHGMILPDTVRSLPWPVWMNWAQVKKPMTKSVRGYILGLDVDADVKMLKAELGLNISSTALDALRCGTVLLQICASLGMSLYEIGLLVYTTSSEDGSRSFVERLLSSSDGKAYWDLEVAVENSFEDSHRDLIRHVLALHPELHQVLVPRLELLERSF